MPTAHLIAEMEVAAAVSVQVGGAHVMAAQEFQVKERKGKKRKEKERKRKKRKEQERTACKKRKTIFHLYKFINFIQTYIWICSLENICCSKKKKDI